MVNFTRHLSRQSDPEWKQYYVNYRLLKRVLIETLTSQPQPKDGGQITRRLSAASDDQFTKALDKEIEKVVLFFMERQGQIATKILEYRARMNSFNCNCGSYVLGECEDDEGRPCSPAELLAEFKAICADLIRLLRFVELNCEAVRKALKKHDKLVSHDMMTGRFLTTRVSDTPESHLRQLYWHNGLNALFKSLMLALEEMPKRCRLNHETAVVVQEDKEAVKRMVESLESVRLARARMYQTSFANFLSLKTMLFDADELQVGGREALAGMMSMPDNMSSWLNIMSIFLTTVSYYITVPTANAYAEDLGLDASYTGVIIGMAPIAQVMSAFVFSWWSNYAFRLPLFLSALLQLVGNLLYALAISYKSVPMLLAGRFVCGSGGAEAVNRRYIADTVPPHQRTVASVAFVTAGALGMAAGPALAALLDSVDMKYNILVFNDATSPAWLMAVLWVIYMVVLLTFFREPLQRVSHSPTARIVHDVETAGNGGSDHVDHFATDHSMLMSPVDDLDKSGFATEITPLNSNGTVTPKYTSIVEGPSDGSYSISPPVVLRRESSGLGSSFLSVVMSRFPAYANRNRPFSVLMMVLRNNALMISLAVYFLIELVDEILLSSASLIADHYFGWGVRETGSLLALLGLMVLPANLVVEKFSAHYEDRSIMVVSQVITIAGLLVILSYWGAYNDLQFLIGTIVIFVAVAVMEGVDTSLISKVIPPVLSRGTFNSGLLAAQVGTLAKAVGDAMITLIAMHADELVDGLYLPILIITVSLLVISLRYFSKLS